MCKEHILLTKEKLCGGLTLFGRLLEKLRATMEFDSTLRGTSTAEGAFRTENNMEFHRIWSAIQFVFCRSTGEGIVTVE